MLTPAAGCSTLLADRWREPVPSAVLAESAGAADWQVFGIEQTGQLAKANGATSDVIETIERCEARDAAAARHINAPIWAFWR